MTYKKVSQLLIFFGMALFLALAVPPIWSKLAQIKPESNVLNPPPAVTSTQAATLPKNLMTNRSLGIGLGGLTDYSTQIPFLDAFRTSRNWYTICGDEDPACQGKGNNNAEVKLDLDENGWVKSLPKPGTGASYTRVATLLYREIPGAFPTGKYVVLYDGEGKIIYEFESKKIEEESRPGRDVINVTGGGAGICLHILETDPNKTGNYIRNIRVVPEQYEKTFATQIFNPAWVEKIKGFQTVRFMDWMETNNSTQKNWEDRPKLTHSTWQGKGAPIEVMVTLANQIKSDAWFNMPHLATDDYIKKFAQYVKEHLDPELKAYVEYSNEVWNWMFQQAHYASEQGKARWGQDLGDAWVQFYGMRAAQVCDIWKKEVFKEASNRVFCVIGTQTAWKGLEESVLNAPKWVAEGNEPPYKHGMDGLAVTGYFSGGLGKRENVDTVLSWRSDPDGGFGKAFKQLREGGLLKDTDTVPDTISLFEYHSKVAKEKGLQLVAYEGGTHIVGTEGAQDNEKLTEFLIAINKHPEMHNIYTMLLNGWKNNGGTLFNHFTDVGQPSKWGSWGALDSLNEKGSPRYNALIDFMKNNPTWWPRE